MNRINRVGVLGAGVMGATIAAHLANSGLEVLLLDMVPRELTDKEKAGGLTVESPEVRNRIAQSGKDGLLKVVPAPYYSKAYANRITTGNFDDDLDKLAECDWVIEVVVENISIKQELLKRISPHLTSETILSTNTSGLSVNDMEAVLPEELRRNFLVTHFFNPPRYMRLMEIVATKQTDPELMTFMADFISTKLGKGVVVARDSPNFIANRIGIYGIYKSIQHMVEMGMTIEEVDIITGPATGRPKSATFRTADLVGIDTLAHVANNSYKLCPEDEDRDVFRRVDFIQDLIGKGYLGNKSGQGFYKKEKVEGKSRISYYDYTTGEYSPLAKPKFGSIGMIKQVDNPAEKIRMLVGADDRAAEYGWRTLRDVLIYTCNRIPEITDNVVSIDNAMRWGFNWELGPFEMLDAIGLEYFAKRVAEDGVAVPEKIRGIDSFYRYSDSGEREVFDLTTGEYVRFPEAKGEISLEIIKNGGGVVEKNSNSSIIDLGDGVFGLEFHSKMNAISGDILSMTQKAIRRAEDDGIGLVIGNQGANFSAGANLMLIAVAMAEGAYDDIAMALNAFQKTTMAIKLSKVPVVTAPFNMTLGGGCEYALHSAGRVASAETYMGLVEIGVGLLPAAGGTKEMCIRAVDLAAQYKTDCQPFVFKYFEQIAMAKVSRSAAELFDMGYMQHGDSVTMNSARLIGDAKTKVQALAVNYRPQSMRVDIAAPGRDVAAAIKSRLWNLKMGNYITPYEEELGGVIADVICGGDVLPGTKITEEYLLGLERESFLRLCTNKKSAERIQHMLKKGKPLRN